MVENSQGQITSESITSDTRIATKVQNFSKDSPNILWCNESSKKLFGQSIVGPIDEELSGSLSFNQLILPQFMPVG